MFALQSLFSLLLDHKMSQSQSNAAAHNVPLGVSGFSLQSHRDMQRHLQQHGFQINARTVVVRFRYQVNQRDNNGQLQWRTATALLDLPANTVQPNAIDDFIKAQLRDLVENHFERLITEWSRPADGDLEAGYGPALEPDPDQAGAEHAIISIIHKEFVMAKQDLVFALGSLPVNPPARTRMYGHADCRTFQYMVQGCDMKTLQHIVPEEWCHNTNPDCDRMCAYRMIEGLGMRNRDNRSMFPPSQVNRWFRDNGMQVGGLTDGLTSDDIQAHAQHHRYTHCAMDLARSVLNMHVPLNPNRNLHTACYVVVGDHCQPITDANVLKSIVQYATHVGSQSQQLYPGHQILGTDPAQQQQQRRKRRRSLDRTFRPKFDRSEDRVQRDTWSEQPRDLEVEDIDDETADVGPDGRRIPLLQNPNQFRLPLVSETDRFHFFTKAEDLHLVEEKCKPDYQEGDDRNLVHYYICTDDDNVEFIYNYLVRVLKIDPLHHARTYNGQCRLIRMKNVWWCAHREVHLAMRLHGALWPTEPFRVHGMATYAFRMLHQEMTRNTRRSDALWESLSHYPPNLQQLLDTCHPFHRPKISQHTYNPPYSNPRIKTNSGTMSTPVQTLIPMANRRRIDLIRSYAATIRHLKDDEFPIHDPTNRVVFFREDVHGTIPIGHYLVDVPTAPALLARPNGEALVQMWAYLPCLPLGQPRMMTHRMLRALLDRNLLTKADIRLACPTDPARQNRYGLALVLAFQGVLDTVYNHPQLQEICPKQIINHLVGLCNGTSLPHSGSRYVFQDLRHLLSLLVNLGHQYGDDQRQNTRILHTVGHDPDWHKYFDYYILDGSGLTYRHFHLQPVYTVVLEDQAMRIYDVARTIPLTHLIQINIDAIEYKIDSPKLLPAWAQELADRTVSQEECAALTPAAIWRDYMGRYKEELPKDETKALLYHYEFGQGNLNASMKRFLHFRDILEEPINPVETPIRDWHAQLRVTEPAVGESDQQWGDLLTQMFTADQDHSGILITGPAGTGKTHTLRSLYQFAVNHQQRIQLAAFTHAACIQMGPDSMTLSSLFGMGPKSDVRCQLALSHKCAALLRTLDLDWLVIDEISMVPLHYLEILMVFHRCSPKTRIALVGDFNQLPPVEPQWERDDNHNYWDSTDMLPYLLFDTRSVQAGRWLKLSECKRTSDPLLVRLVKEPLAVCNIQPSEFPMPPAGVPVWRFISKRNSTRKAVNFYCMHRFLQQFPTQPRVRLILAHLWAEHRNQQQRRSRQRSEEENASAATNNVTPEQFATAYHPGHWQYLQNFTYAVGMEVVCRSTMERWTAEDQEAPHPMAEVVNNRRAVIREVDTETKNITIRWVDLVRRFEDRPTPNWCEYDVTLTFHDFAFHFVPGFCITAHMAQGETIKEHYAILEWMEMTKMPRMAYVAVTRGAAAQFLHIVPFDEPWNTGMDTGRMEDNVLRKLCKAFRWDREQTYDLDVDMAIQLLEKNPACADCHKTPLLTHHYAIKSPDQFMFLPLKGDSLSPSNCKVVCQACFTVYTTSRWMNKKANAPTAVPSSSSLPDEP